MPSQLPISTEVQATPNPTERAPRTRLQESWRWCCRLSVIEPLVAVAWHASFSHALGRRLPTAKGVLLFNSLWLVYAADRLLDVQNLPKHAQPQTDRHRFAFQFTKGLTCVWLFVFGYDRSSLRSPDAQGVARLPLFAAGNAHLLARVTLEPNAA